MMNDLGRDFMKRKRYRCANPKLWDVITNNKVECKCGHKVFIPHYVNKTYCTWCHRTVYRNEQEEFKDKLQKQLAKK